MEILNFVGDLSPEQEKVYEKIWQEKLHNENGRTFTGEDWSLIK